MKIYIYSEFQNWIEHSGVGRAIYHQKNAISRIGEMELVNCKEDADIIHINTIFPGSVSIALWAKRHGKKVVFHAHSTKEDFRNSFIGSNAIAGLFGKWIRFCYQLGDVVVTPSDYAKKLLQSQGMVRPVCVMSNGIDLEYYQRKADDRDNFRAKYGYSEDEKVIMSAGLWIRRKGILDFIEMAQRLPDYQFIWFGDSNLWSVPKEIRKAVHSRLPNLRFAGYVPKEELRQAYAGSDLFWFPTYEETEGIVVLEALAMKIPVLLRDIPVYQDWLSNGQNVYMFQSQEQAAHKIKDICSGNVPDLTAKGYQVAVERSMNHTGKHLQEIYQLALL
ncbi:MAG: glycosyltransferase family 4 protein [Lachnospiraceae bacterium]|nr:glycosyltransferase family 4 protein [Lachnospiraceae bacterium]